MRKVYITHALIQLWYIGVALEPFLPETSEKILKQLQGGKQEILFPRK